MLNKQSFNLMQALNEAEEVQIKKKITVDSYHEELIESEDLIEKSLGNNTFTDEDEAEYYRNKELYATSHLARHRDAMNKAKEACEKKGIKVNTEQGVYESSKLDEERIYRNPESDPKADEEFVKVTKGEANKEELKEDENTDKEERLASLKTQLEVDGDQLSDDEKEAIQQEIINLENELNEGCNKGLTEGAGDVDLDEMVEAIENWYTDYSSMDAFYEDLANVCNYDKVESWFDSLEDQGEDTQKYIDAEDTSEKLKLIEEYYQNWSDKNAYYMDLANAIDDYSKVVEWYNSLENMNEGEAIDANSEIAEECDTLKEDEENLYGSEVNDKVGGDYHEFLEEMSNFRISMVDQVDNFSTHLAGQIAMETVMAFDGLLVKYEREKDIEITGALGESAKVINESEKLVEEAQISKIKEVKSQGNVFMIETAKEFIVGENYNESEGILENAEIYESKEEADKDYLARCEITKDGKPANLE